MEMNEIVLRILRRHNSYISHILDSSKQVEAYMCNINANRGEFIIRGTLFVYSSYVPAYYGFIILDPLQLCSLCEPVCYSSVEVNERESGLLKYARYDCPFYVHLLNFASVEECDRIGQLLVDLMQDEEQDVYEKQDLAYRTRNFRIYEVHSDDEFEYELLQQVD
ncbi:mRNA-decapping enzyme 1B-like [Clavelina lepadiformis]|uniref:mRNA-decapping enzyme 1B-like n=1 Tax=Clavelina lepadiformis TaxID=159417 RepID=UPI0040420708